MSQGKGNEVTLAAVTLGRLARQEQGWAQKQGREAAKESPWELGCV